MKLALESIAAGIGIWALLVLAWCLTMWRLPPAFPDWLPVARGLSVFVVCYVGGMSAWIRK